MVDTFRDDLKDWVIEQARNKVDSKGKPCWTMVESGKSHNLESFSIAGKKLHYHPDIIFIENKSKWFMNIRSSKNLQELVGELVIAKAADEYGHSIFILLNADFGLTQELIDNVVSIIDDKANLDAGYFLVLTEKECNDIQLAKLKLRKDLPEWI